MGLFKNIKWTAMVFLLASVLLVGKSHAAASDSEKIKKKLQKQTLQQIKKGQKQEVKDKVSASKRASWFAYALRESSYEKRISTLDLDHEKVPVFLVPTENALRPLIKLKFSYPKEDWTLYDAEKKPLQKGDGDHEFVLYAFLKSRVSTVQLYAVGPNEELEEEVVYVYAPEAQEFKTSSVFESLVFRLGHTYYNYKQSGYGTFASNSLFLGLDYRSPEKGKSLGYYGNVGVTLYTYNSSPERRSTHFLEADAGLSYVVPLIKNPKYRSRLHFGLNTANLYTFEGEFGFEGLFGPSIGLRTEYFRSGANSFAASLTLTPYDFSDILGESRLKLSVDWTLNLRNLRRAQVGFAYSRYDFTSSPFEISADMFSLYFGMSF